MTDHPMLDAAERLKQLRDEKDALEEDLKRVNAGIQETDRELCDIMAQEETPSFTHAGFQYSLTTKLRASAKAGLKPEFFTALREKGAGDLIQETINANTLSSFVKEQMAETDDALPAWLEPYVNVYPQISVSVRKANRK